MMTLRDQALNIFKAGLKAADSYAAVQRFITLRENRLSIGTIDYCLGKKHADNIFVIGFGKGAARMALAVQDKLGSLIRGGIVIVKYGHSQKLDRIEVREAGHPIPDISGVRSTEELLHLLKGTGPCDLVICLISGGGSSLLTAPFPPVSLADKQILTQKMLEVGADIYEINTLRKHLSRVKGGRLAEAAHPSTLISLILSDVIGDRPEIIASGPTVPDPSTFGDCLAVLDKYGLSPDISPAILNHLRLGCQGKVEETPKPGDAVFSGTENLIIGSNRGAAAAAEKKAAELGYNTLILSTEIQGDTREAARLHIETTRRIYRSGLPIPRPACLISGGETTVVVKGGGKGGRNQEFVLASVPDLKGMEDILVLSCGTDGTDGPTDAAGAMADGQTAIRADKLGMDPVEYLENNDSYHFFQRLNDLVITGPTCTNVMDLRLVLIN